MALLKSLISEHAQLSAGIEHYERPTQQGMAWTGLFTGLPAAPQEMTEAVQEHESDEM